MKKILLAAAVSAAFGISGVQAAEDITVDVAVIGAGGAGLSAAVEAANLGAKVVVVEDLVSTGGSSLSAVEALREAGCDVLGMVAIFTYGFPTAAENFAGADVKLDTLSDYKTMIELAAKQGYVHEDELQTLQQWRRDPANWKKSAQ